MRAPGAVFRNKGDRYRLKYKCATHKSGMNVVIRLRDRLKGRSLGLASLISLRLRSCDLRHSP
ncbi:DUF930 domain-containing protein [Rhizobium leguminosarum]|nr:DUF930 domain-containing protein [Rhizobium leguminosarum]